MESVDLVVVGTGWFGLAAAKTYIELHPNENVVVVETAATVGGTWAAHRHYPGLLSNNLYGTYQYSDFPMDESYGVKPGQHIPAAIVHQYLTNYAKHFGFFDRIRFNTKVQSAEPGKDGGWILKTSTDNTDSSLHTNRLIVATGLTSEEYIPTMAGSETFGAPLFHTKNFLEHEDTLKTAKTVTVLGGAKSAWDAAYAYATAGATVNLVIRKSGRGPMWMTPAYVTPLKKWLEKLVHTRFLTWLSPCVWGSEDGYPGMRNFFHGTAIGRAMVNTFWKILAADVVALNEYDKHPEVKKLKPWHDAFWIGSALSVLNNPTSFFDLVKDGKIKVHVAEITHLSEKTVHLDNGEALPSDVLVCGTGWKAHPPINFVGSASDEELGLPFHSDKPDDMAKAADLEILKQFPRLKDQPELNVATDTGNDGANRPFRLYRFMVPPSHGSDRSIAFAGMITTITTSISAQTQALWISAYFDAKLDRYPASQDTINWETVLHSQFGKWRYPTGFARVPDFVFDGVPYIDMLLKDLGLKSHRKAGAMKEIFSPYGPEDYTGLIDEWKEGHEKKTV